MIRTILAWTANNVENANMLANAVRYAGDRQRILRTPRHTFIAHDLREEDEQRAASAYRMADFTVAHGEHPHFALLLDVFERDFKRQTDEEVAYAVYLDYLKQHPDAHTGQSAPASETTDADQVAEDDEDADENEGNDEEVAEDDDGEDDEDDEVHDAAAPVVAATETVPRPADRGDIAVTGAQALAMLAELTGAEPMTFRQVCLDGDLNGDQRGVFIRKATKGDVFLVVSTRWDVPLIVARSQAEITSVIEGGQRRLRFRDMFGRYHLR